MLLDQVLTILPQQLLFGLTLGSVYALLALGYSMVYGVLFMINFAHGDVFMLGSMIGWLVLNFALGGQLSSSPAVLLPAMLLSALLICSVVGVSIEFVAYRPLYARGASRLGPLISAIGVSLFIENVVLATLGARPRVYPTSTLFRGAPSLSVAGIELSALVITIVLLSVVTMFGLDWLVARTRWGRGMRAVAENRDVARMMGVNLNQVVSLTFLVGSALAGIGGVLIGLYYTQTDFLLGWYAGLKAFAAAVLGGIGNIRGAMLGGVLLGVIESIGITLLAVTAPLTGFGTGYKDLIAFAVLILVLIFRPTGLLGERVAERL